MPWKETCAMDQRARFIIDVHRGELSKAELCRQYGISRPTGDKWLGRYAAGGLAALDDMSRAPHRHPNETPEELAELRELGLSLFYVGCESGDDLVLDRVSKGETFATSLDALKKIKAAGSKSSVMILNGMGGTRYSEQHAKNSARLMNEAQPEYLATLVVSFPMGTERYQAGFRGEFEPLEQPGLFREMEWLLDTLDLESTIFRSDHASNYLVLKGTLNRDRQRLLEMVRTAIRRPGEIPLRQEWQRGL